MHGQGFRAGLLLAVMLAYVIPARAADDLFIGQVRVEDARMHPADGAPLRYRILHADPAGLQAQLAGWALQAEPVTGGVTFTLGDYPAVTAQSTDARYTAESFLIDYREAAVQALTGPVEQQYGAQPAARQLEQFVHDYITEKSGAHGFDVASQVAKSRAGDCTEHAVLLTALLRLYGYPARTVTGLYVSLEAPLIAYGHAWTEYYADGSWQGLDGTRISDSVGAQYLPLGVVDGESIGYTIGLISTLQNLAIERVIVE